MNSAMRGSRGVLLRHGQSSRLSAVKSIYQAQAETNRIRVDQPPSMKKVTGNTDRPATASINRLLDREYRSQVESFNRILNGPDGQRALARLENELMAEQRKDELKQLKTMVSDIPYLMYLPSVSAGEEPSQSTATSSRRHQSQSISDIKSSNERRLALQLPRTFSAYLTHIFKEMDRDQLDSFIKGIPPDHLRKLESLYQDVLAFGSYSPNEIPKRYSEISNKMDLLQSEIQQVTDKMRAGLPNGTGVQVESKRERESVEEESSPSSPTPSSPGSPPPIEDRKFLDWKKRSTEGRPNKAKAGGSLFKNRA